MTIRPLPLCAFALAALAVGAIPARAADTCPLPRPAAEHHAAHKVHHPETIAAETAPPVVECQSYHRAVAFPAGCVREAAGTACLGGDGVWRVADEHLLPAVRPVPVYEEAVYAAPVYAAPVYAEPAYAEAVYAGPVYAPYYAPAYAPAFVSFGFGYGGWRGGHGWRG